VDKSNKYAVRAAYDASIPALILCTVPLLRPTTLATRLMPMRRPAHAELARSHRDHSAGGRLLAVGNSAPEPRLDACVEHAALKLSEGPTHLKHEVARWRSLPNRNVL
jgi:hypothetical protein